MSEVTSVVEQEQQQQENVGGSSNTELRCNDCNVSFNSDKSLEVHLQYHHGNLLNQWRSQAQHHESNNNNNNKAGNHNNRHVKSDNVIASVDPKEQSSILSSQDPTSSQQQQQQQPQPADQAYNHFLTPISYSETNYNILQNMSHVQNISMATCQPFSPSHEDIQNNGGCSGPGGAGGGGYARYHPYQTQHFPPERVTNSSTSPQTPPFQCDKCGAIYDDATLLSEHMRTSHSDSPTAYPSAPQYQQLGGSPQHQEQQQQQQQAQQQMHTSPPQSNQPHQQTSYDYNGGQTVKLEIKQDPEEQTEILDLDSHKVQTHRYEEELMRIQQQQHQQDFQMQMHQHQVLHQPPQRLGTHSVSSMLGWPPVGQTHDYHSMSAMPPMDSIAPMTDQGQFMRGQHMPVETPVHTVSPIITNAQQIPGHQMPTGLMQQPSKTSMTNQSWKSNEARRPKTYNCTACNKWFTSSGHLKRHYNTTLHKNAVKQSNQPDPANMPISAHHHPGRENSIGHSTSSRGGGSSERSPDLTSSASPPNSMAGPSGEATGGLLHTPTTLYNSNSNSNGSNSNDSSATMVQSGPPSVVHLGSGIASLNSPQQSPMARHHQQQMDSPSHQVALQQQQQQQQQQPQLLPVHLPMNSPGQLQVHHSMNSPISPMHPPPASHITSPSQMGSSSHHVHMNSPLMSGTAHPAMVSPTAMGGTTMPHQPYPNGMPPHVTNTIPGLLGSTNILLTIGNEQNEQQHQQQQQQQQQSREDELPSFGIFGNHQRSLPSFIVSLPGYIVEPQSQAVNVGGPTPEDTPQKSFDSSGSNFDVYSSSPSYEMMHVDSSIQANAEGMIAKQYEIQNQQSFPSRQFLQKQKYYENNNNVVRAKEDLNIDSSTRNTKRRKNEILKEQFICSSIDSADDAADSDERDKKTYRCYECDKKFNKPCYLTQHNKSFHSGVKPFKCSQCGKRFPTKTQHEEHLQKHAGEKPHKCQRCPKQFNHKTDLRRHFCLHTGEKPFVCGVCTKGFIRKDHMKKHYETHKKKNSRQKENFRGRMLSRT